ncbi:GNAT family N-acetyltransferase [Nitrobacteraceae bacterium UC4446_H13]
MTMAAAIESRVTEARAQAETTRVADVEIFRDMAAAEPAWRALEGPGSVLTPYQRFDLLAAWQNHIGVQTGIEPLIAVARDARRQPMMLLPFGIQRNHGVGIASFLGDKHITFNMPICRRDFLATATRGDIDAVLDALRAPSLAVDALTLARQPRHWQNLANPMALLPTQAAVNGCPLMTIEVNAAPTTLISNSFRRRLKSKEKKLQALSGYRYLKAATDADIARLLDAFFAIKPQRMALQKLPNVFADPGVEEFIRRACHTELPDGGRAIEIHALVCDEEMIAIYAGVADGDRFSMMFNTYTLSASAHFSPGLILMRYIVDHYAALNYSAIDLGIGSDDYKRLFCKSDEPIFDSFIGLNARGKMAASGLSAMAHLKRLVKQTPALMKAAQTIRGSLNR